MGLESLPVVCKYCREPLRYIRTESGSLMLIERGSGDQHFLGDKCPVVEGLARATQVAQQGWRMKG